MRARSVLAAISGIVLGCGGTIAAGSDRATDHADPAREPATVEVAVHSDRAREPAVVDVAVRDAELAVQAVNEVNGRSAQCMILTQSACCYSFSAVLRSEASMRPELPGYWQNPDCTEGPPNSRPRGPVLCFGQRVPTGVALMPDGTCQLEFSEEPSSAPSAPKT